MSEWQVSIPLDQNAMTSRSRLEHFIPNIIYSVLDQLQPPSQARDYGLTTLSDNCWIASETTCTSITILYLHSSIDASVVLSLWGQPRYIVMKIDSALDNLHWHTTLHVNAGEGGFLTVDLQATLRIEDPIRSLTHKPPKVLWWGLVDISTVPMSATTNVIRRLTIVLRKYTLEA